MKALRNFLLLSLLISTCAAARHEYYVSVATAEYNPESGMLEVGLKVFTDDLERCLEQQGGRMFKLSKTADSRDADDVLADYLETHFVLTTAGKLQPLTYLGKEVGVDETWLYFEVKALATGSFQLKHMVFFEIFESQVNILHLTANGKKSSYYVNSAKPVIDISW